MINGSSPHEPDGRAALLRSRSSIDAAVQAVQQHRPTIDGFMDRKHGSRKHGSKTKGAPHEPGARSADSHVRELFSVVMRGHGSPRSGPCRFMVPMRDSAIEPHGSRTKGAFYESGNQRPYGVRGQAQRDTALASGLESAAHAKAPSPLRSAGALHRDLGVARFMVREQVRLAQEAFP
jgi:hypothetical protein